MGAVTRTLGEICDEVGGIIRTGPFGSQLHHSDYVSEGVPVVMPKDILEGKISRQSIAQINEDNAKRLAQHRLKAGDIVYGRRGDIGRQALVTEHEAGWLCGTGCLRISLGGSVIDPTFLHYYLRDHSVIKWIANQAIGATLPNLNTSILRSVPVKYPDLKAQREIAGILSAYDDLIENNTWRIKILEKMAQSLYREWFVHFRFPGNEKFSFLDSPIGKVPEGWLSSYPDYVDFLEGPGLRNWQYRNEGIPFLNIRTLVNNDIDSSKLQHVDEQEVRQRYPHFLLQPYDHIVSSSGTIGRIVTVQKRHLPLMLNTSVIRMRPKKKAIDKWQLKHFLQSNYFQDQIRAQASGVAQANYGPSHLKTMWILAPKENVGQAYESLVSPLEELICQLVNKNSNLSRSRDLLLPKLISGELGLENMT